MAVFHFVALLWHVGWRLFVHDTATYGSINVPDAVDVCSVPFGNPVTVVSTHVGAMPLSTYTWIVQATLGQ